ncbi:thiol peroxidase [Clostridiisalibacter paucivorans]|uniref:thiol peroxidase n=1 Tax=Clostridiisalibacter paucivorans TaxID=408753 RepID=UPI00047A9C94|nr:thiol peroxidase [Clostridiisalibacter paucivorans]
MQKDIKFGGNPVTITGKEIKIGDKAPNFNAVNNDLSVFDFHKETEGKIKIISAVPSVDTKVCSLQTIRFNDEASKLSDDVVIVTVSVDLPFAQERFCGAEGIKNIHVVSDYKDLDFGQKYGFIIDEFRLLTRGVVIVDKDNIVKYVEFVKEVTNYPDFDRALEEVKKLL